MIAKNLSEVRERISQSILKSKRNPDTIRLVVVSKQVGIPQIEEARTAGATVFGENKIQEAGPKIDQIGTEGISWHFIGHLQKNKVKFLGERFDLIHSVDSFELAEKIAKQCHSESRVQSVLLQVNVSGETAKFGMEPEELEKQVMAFSQLQGIKVEGLMTIPPFDPDPENSRKHFSRLRELRDQCEKQNSLTLPELSMGMSHDFEVAVEEGATLVRVGTAIFGPRRATPGEN
ncbi:MAG: YggS family pyridoxal phosphate-dependent enzyme [Nitrospina sp.]|nr:YggS family pyridoxal phosphate-dependent enzyme [Nitrospina sp.]MBT3508767.1 YggS family pyridoxal phosphate-dependent enzyme [Nitrospina sp.]MBT3874601.1 YggS family pyridoxal phosphate-dependent enzyme [Nitrospina sp.]MBT4047075.1 YggS family pyridoxal phosphate-dependent enzyme [Nitrospina sp.]MBT4557903.1 YggS family pyridoxal phosphate-dependent enzyme [Nitrospina sp.]